MPSYGQFCPVAKTAELFCERWTPLIVRELLCGSTRFGEIQRGVPLASPSLLSKRLRHLVSAGVLRRSGTGADSRYEPTQAGWELYPIVEAMGVWGQRWVRSSYDADELDPTFLMWDIRRMVAPEGLADGPCVVEFWIRNGPPRKTTFWLVVEPDAIDLCLVDPGREVDLRVEADLRSLTRAWMGDITLTEAMGQGQINLLGPPELASKFPAWLGHHPRLGGIAPART